MLKNRISILSMVLLLSMSVLIPGLELSSAATVPLTTRGPLVSHAPIHIYQNLSQKASQEGWTGTGVEGDPFIIEDLDIDATGSNYGFFISSTEEHFVIRNCRVRNADTETSPQYKGNAIYLIQVSNGTIEDCEIFDSNYQNLMVNMCDNLSLSGNKVYGSSNNIGIMTWRSQDIMIEGNEVFDNPSGGMEVSACERVVVEGNILEGNGGNGISVSNIYGSSFKHNIISNNTLNAFSITGYCPDNEFLGNIMIGGSITFYMDSGTLGDHTITSNNTVDGGPVYYYKNLDMTGSSVPADAGEVILANVKGLTISSINFEAGTAAIIAGYCEGISIGGCELEGQLQGITVFETSNSTIEANVISNIEYNAISIQGGQGNLIKENDITNVNTGVILYGSTKGNIVTHNRISDCDTGISLYMSYMDAFPGTGNEVEFNTIETCTNKGIYAQMEEGSTIANNSVKDAWIGIELFNTKNITVSGNLVLRNDIGISVNGRYWGSSWHNDIIDNRIEDTNGTGIELNRSMGGSYAGNLLYRSKSFGVWIGHSHSNVLKRNTFLWNNGSTITYSPSHIQARDDSTDNDWDSGGFGNYWSDWQTPDADGNGIVDDPYLIFGDENFDNRPLTDNPVVVISEPMALKAVPGDSMVALSWSPPARNFDTEIIEYIVHRRQGDDPALKPIHVIGTVTEMVDSTVENNLEYHYSVAAVNKYGMGPFSPEVMVTPDGTPPMVQITSPDDGHITNRTNITFVWIGADDVSFDHFEIRMDNGTWMNVGGNLTSDLGPFDEGEHVFHLAGEDKVGNRNETDISFIVDRTAPVVTITNDPEDLIVNRTELLVEWEGSDEYGIDRYELLVNGGAWMDVNTSSSYLVKGLEEGVNEVVLRVRDLAGNINSSSIQITVDLTAPELRILWPVDGLDTLDRNITVEWFTSDTGPGPLTHRVKLDAGLFVDFGEALQCEMTDLEVGNHTITVKAMDAAGNTIEKTVSFTVYEDELPIQKVTISGKVVDKNGDPISGVKVTSDDGAETSTDSSGDFVILVEKGPRMLKFSKKGYKDWTVSVDANDNMTIPSGDVVLEEREEDEPFLGLRRGCYICFAIPMGILLLLIIIGLIARLTRKKVREDVYEE
ncbi:MAG: right-handed parallel beta-helix repeat-containing protein [Thermoplasmatota archaeon]